MSTNTGPWWERFFDGENQLHWSVLSNREDPWAEHVLPWVKLAQDTNVDLPIVLPRLAADNQPSWYCASRTTRGALRLREALQAFIGPSYSDFDGRPYLLNANDPVEAAFAEGTASPAYRIRASKPGDVNRIQRALQFYLGLLNRMPKQEQHTRRPFGTLRLELDRAVTAGNEAGARRLLERIRRFGRLDAENLLFLEVGVRAGLGHWREIAEDAVLLNQLNGLRLPPRVLADVLEAFYRLHIEPCEDINTPERALDAFRTARLTRRSTLFGTRRGLRSSRVIKAFFLYELAREDADQLRLAGLASELEQLDDIFAHALATLRPATEPQAATDPMLAADEAFDNLEIDRALELYLQAPPSRKRISRLIRCAEDVGTVEAATRVQDAIEPGDDVENLPPSWSSRLSVLEQICATDQANQTPQGWLDWARLVETGMNEDEAMSTLRKHMATWDSGALACQKESMAELAGIINNATGSAEHLFREAAPLLYQALIPESGTPSRQVKPLLEILVTKVAFLSDPSQNELDLARDLAGILLFIGLDEKEYASLVSDLEDLMGAQMSVFTLGWSLDLADLLAIHACPSPEQRLRLVLRVIEQARRIAHRISTTDILVIEKLCQDFELKCPKEITRGGDADASGTSDELSGKKIGIYTLVEPAGQRAAVILEQLCSAVQVELNCDHECSKRLIHLARSADLFVFAWKSSKHQAFYCVKDNRDPANPMIQAQGKGTSSILRAIFDGI